MPTPALPPTRKKGAFRNVFGSSGLTEWLAGRLTGLQGMLSEPLPAPKHRGPPGMGSPLVALCAWFHSSSRTSTGAGSQQTAGGGAAVPYRSFSIWPNPATASGFRV